MYVCMSVRLNGRQTSDLHESRGLRHVCLVVVVEGRDVSAVQEAVLVDGGRRLLGHVHVSHEDVSAAVAQLLRVGGDPGLRAADRAAAVADAPVARGRHLQYILCSSTSSMCV